MARESKLPQPSTEWTIPREELDRLVRDHQGTLTDVLMTPTMAGYILETYNTGNRKLRQDHADSFASTIMRSGWENTGEPMIFAKEGILNNGQHRLEGIVRSNIPVLMDIRFGIARKAFANTDTGAKRGPGDVLSIWGSSSPFAAAAALRLLLAYEAGLPDAYINKIDNDQILQAFRRWPKVERAIDLNHNRLARRGFMNASSNAFTFLALRQVQEATVIEFLSLVESGLARSKNDPPRLLRERLLSDEKLTRSSRAAVIERFALFIKSWNFWCASERPKALRWISSEPFPVMNGVRLS